MVEASCRIAALRPQPDHALAWAAVMSGPSGSDKRRMASVPLPAVDFEYSVRVFGDGDVVDLNRRDWGAVRMRRCLASLADVRGRVLEIGCGAGRCIRTIHRHRPDLEAVGCDLSARSIEAARRYGGGIAYETADATALPYNDASFDAVVIMDLIEHLPDVGRALDEVHRICKPGARLHLHVPCEGHWLSVYRPLLAVGIDLTRRAVGHVHHFTRQDVHSHLSAAGFEVTRRRYSMYLFGQLHDLIAWWSMLREGHDGRPGDKAKNVVVSGPIMPPQRERFRLKHLCTRPAWWVAKTFLPWLQYGELAIFGWQPVGSVGLCVTATRRR